MYGLPVRYPGVAVPFPLGGNTGKITRLLTWFNQYQKQVYWHAYLVAPVNCTGVTRYVHGCPPCLGTGLSNHRERPLPIG